MEMREATVISVDPDEKRVTIKFDYGSTKDPLIVEDVKMSCFSGKRLDGKVPEEGEQWLVHNTSDSAEQWYLFHPKDNEGEYNSTANPGDHGWELPLGSRVMLRKDGSIELYSKATSSMYFIPSEDLVQLITENFELVTPQGKMSWKPNVLDFVVGHGVGESTLHMRFGSTGKDFGVKEWETYTNDEGDPLAVYASMACGAFHSEIAEDGSYSEETQHRGVSVLGDSYMDVEGATKVNLDGDAVVDTAGVSVATKTTVYWQAKVSITFSAAMIKLDTPLLILTEEDGFAVDGLQLLKWFLSDFKALPNGSIDPSCMVSFLQVLNTKVRI